MEVEISQWIAALADPDPDRRAEAAERLARVATEARTAAVPLVRLAGDGDERVREWVVAALEELGAPVADDLPALIGLLEGHGGDGDVGYWAATLIGRLRQRGAAAVGALIAALEHAPQPPVRQRAAWALGQIGPPASAAISSLERAANDADPRLARLADRSIAQIGR